MKEYKYKVSVVIPVYNVDKFLNECVDSIINQNFKFEDVQVILINDGSADNSESICKDYSNKYENVLYIKQENKGVSSARNNGIKHSEGKYIMILDSDDYVSKNTLSSLYKFMEEHYNEIDLVTYPIHTFNTVISNKPLPRYKILDKGSGIYDLNEYFNFQQKTINIMFKNLFKDNLLYNESMELSEDQDYNTRILMNKQKIGYVDSCKYFYRRIGIGASNTKNNPFYCFNSIIDYNEKLLESYKCDGIIPKYIQNLVITTLCWRIQADELFPYSWPTKEFDKAKKRVYDLIKKIDLDVISKLDTSIYIKLYFLLVSERKIDYKIKNNKIKFMCDDLCIMKYNPVFAEVFEYKIKNDYLYLGAVINSLIMNLKNVSVYLVIEEKDKSIKRKKITLEKSNGLALNCDDINNKINVLNIREKINLKNVKKLNFEIKINNEFIPISFKFNKFIYRFVYGKNKMIKYLEKNKSKTFYICKNNKLYVIFDSLKQDFKYLLKNKKAFIYRFLSKLCSIKYHNSYIYSDRNDLIDNAYYQFKHDFNFRDKYKRFYITDLNLDKYFTKEELKYVVKPHSFKHKMIFLNSLRIYSSFSDLQIYCPFNNGISDFKDIKKYEFIYLQHGLLHASLQNMYSKEKTEIGKFIISSDFEKDNLISKYNYKSEDLVCSTMPRMSINSLNKKEQKNRIVYAPSWRKYLIGSSLKGKRVAIKNVFLKSNFCNDINSFLKSKKLNDLLEKYDLYLDLKFHPIMKEYDKEFYTNDRIRLIDTDIKLDEYKVFITDFSSFQFDYIKLKNPIIYYVPDYNEFVSGLHSYRKLDLEYENAFGNLCKNEEEILKELDKVIKNKFIPEKKYISRMENFFYDVKNPTDIIGKI